MLRVKVSFTKRNVLFTDECLIDNEADCERWRNLSQTPAGSLINGFHVNTLKMWLYVYMAEIQTTDYGVCTHNMIQNQFRGTVMRMHKSWSSQECQTGQNKKLDFGLWCRTGHSLCLCLLCNTDHIRSIQMNLFLIILFRLFLISAQLIGIYTLLYTDWFGSSQYEPVNNASQLIVCSNRDLIF